MLLWLSLFKATTEEELQKIKAMGVPVMNQAIDAYYSITASSEFRELERMREKASHDEAQALYHAEQMGLEKGIAKGLAKGRTEGLTEGLAKGLAKGRTEGLAKGRAEGISERNMEIARTLLKMGMPFSQVSEATGLASEKLEAINR